MAARSEEPDQLLALLDNAPALVLLVDAETVIRWINQPAAQLFGVPIEDAVGRSVLEFLDPDWDPAAFESIATAMGGTGERQPMLFRANRADGSQVIVEVTANAQMDDPVLGGMVCYVRRWDERYLLDQALEAMAASRPLAETLGILVEVATAETLEADAAILHDRVGDWFEGAVASVALPGPLTGPTVAQPEDVVAAWTEVFARTVEAVYGGVVLDVDELPSVLGTPARALGYETLWVWPGEGRGDRPPQAAALAWRREPHLDVDQTRRQAMGRLARIAGLVLERVRGEEATAHAAAHDALTGLANRATFYVALEEALAAGGEPGVLYLDLDGFKPVNDEHGHGVGDALLVEVARRLRAVVPVDALAARLGGDEFAVVCPAAVPEELEALAAAIVESLDAPVALQGAASVRVGVSIGIASAIGVDAVGADALVEAADAALYEAKAAGGGAVRRAAAGAPIGAGAPRPHRRRPR